MFHSVDQTLHQGELCLLKKKKKFENQKDIAVSI